MVLVEKLVEARRLLDSVGAELLIANTPKGEAQMMAIASISHNLKKIVDDPSIELMGE